MLANVKRAMAITANLNRLTFNDPDEVRALFSDLIGKKVDDSFLLIPPFYTTGGVDISTLEYSCRGNPARVIRSIASLRNARKQQRPEIQIETLTGLEIQAADAWSKIPPQKHDCWSESSG
jgi:hypothetical protein